MFYRVINQILQPYTLLSLMLAVACANLWRQRRETPGRLWAVAAPLALLLLISTPAASYLAFATLEWRFEPLTQLPEGNQAIVVLGGWSMPADIRRPHPMLGADSIDRCLHAAELYHRGGGPCLILVSGGQAEPEKDQPPVGPLMKELLAELGVAPADVLVEDRSSSTYENARECQKILAQRHIERVTLVAKASDMLRASWCFRRVGCQVTPAPCDFKAGKFDASLSSFLPSARAATGSGDVAHEWLG